jgi:protein CpxP
MKTTKLLTSAATLFAVASIAVAAAPDSNRRGGHGPFRHRLMAKLAEVGVTDAQKEQIHAILREFHPSMQPLVKQYVQERRALRNTIHATPVNEPAIRAQAARVAQLQADLAVKRAYVSEKLRTVLTPEQLEKFKELEAKFDAKADKMGERVSRKIAEE